jgi:hypothetical protein
VQFYYIKSTQFRVVHVDGVIGGLTPRGHIHLAAYSERSAIPQITQHTLTDTGQLSDPIAQDGKAGIVREIDVDLIMTITTATELRDFLDARIRQFREIEATEAQKNLVPK